MRLETTLVPRSSAIVAVALALVLALSGCSEGTGAIRPEPTADAGSAVADPDAAPGPVTPPAERCEIDAHCDDGNPCTADTCEAVGGGEFIDLACRHETIATCGEEERSCALACDDGDPCTEDVCREFRGGGDIGEDDCRHREIDRCRLEPTDPTTPIGTAGDPVDPACASGEPTEDVFLPYVPLGTPAVDASCRTGLEAQNCRGVIVARSTSPAGSPARSLVVDFATYTIADRLRIEGTLASGETYVLMDTCRVSTWHRADPTHGAERPLDETIRRFDTVELRAGTVELRFDSTFTSTPWYERVLGLCDFTITPPTGACATLFRETSL